MGDDSTHVYCVPPRVPQDVAPRNIDDADNTIRICRKNGRPFCADSAVCFVGSHEWAVEAITNGQATAEPPSPDDRKFPRT